LPYKSEPLKFAFIEHQNLKGINHDPGHLSFHHDQHFVPTEGYFMVTNFYLSCTLATKVCTTPKILQPNIPAKVNAFLSWMGHVISAIKTFLLYKFHCLH